MKRILLLAVALPLGGCLSLAPRPAPTPSVPPAFVETSSAEAVSPTLDWWSAFGSEDLSTLVTTALAANPDITIAGEHVRQAEAQVRIAGSSLFPALDVSAATQRRETRPSGGSFTASDSTSAGFSASYELDLWGRERLGVRAVQAGLRATRYDEQAARLSVVAGVADAYFQVLSVRGRLTIARENLAIAERVYKVVDSRFRNGAVSELDRAQQETAVLSQRAGIPPLELQERQTLFALAILLGRAPEGFDTAATSLEGVRVPQVAPGLPAELLVRRPDLASAEAQIAAANANVGVARAALLPGIQLTGSAGLASSVLINLLKAPTAALSVGASLAQPIFDGGRLRGQLALARSREREAVEVYRRSILAALADVESTLSAVSHTAEQTVLQEQVVEQARNALRLAEVRYREGADDLLALLDAQRTLFQAQDQLAQLRLQQLQSAVDVFKALGGGWVVPDR